MVYQRAEIQSKLWRRQFLRTFPSGQGLEKRNTETDSHAHHQGGLGHFFWGGRAKTAAEQAPKTASTTITHTTVPRPWIPPTFEVEDFVVEGDDELVSPVEVLVGV